MHLLLLLLLLFFFFFDYFPILPAVIFPLNLLFNVVKPVLLGYLAVPFEFKQIWVWFASAHTSITFTHPCYFSVLLLLYCYFYLQFIISVLKLKLISV